MFSIKTFLVFSWALGITLLSGLSEEAYAAAPQTYQVKMETTKGTFYIDVNRSWSPNGADRFYELVNSGFYNDCAFFRVIEGFMAQVGINGAPATQAKWRDQTIQDDPVVKSNLRGYVSFAKTGAPNSRTTQIFINFGDNRRLDRHGFTPFGIISPKGMKVVDALYSGYGEGAPSGRGPSQQRMQLEGNQYLKQDFPRLDYITKATIVKN
ncbi:peptidylprolyl isomerase [Gimesia fumaroli]|uniref:peptidylprolyl isomerase n=1 Tax=Gimesia fumaroli TaxID=2527976 RepID=A0A518II84_9PLAN|nr:peptidylprolyl isomerase [Gimesia fumaroli]QDV52804.1 Peptidyl-prolyl cis-trans isomerase A precursor [Gimesia fumaroli]